MTRRHFGWILLPMVLLAGGPVGADELNGWEVQLGAGGDIVSWYNPELSVALDYMLDLSVEFLTTDLQYELGYPMYYCRPAYLREPPHVGYDWYTNPADVCSGFVHSYVDDHYAYSGDDRIALQTTAFAQYMIAQGSTERGTGWAWPGCPYPMETWGVLPPRHSNRGGSIMPHFVGKLGRGYLWLYYWTEESAYLTAAEECADALAANVRPGSTAQSPWPWLVNPETGAVYDGAEYCADVIDPIALLNELIALGSTGGGAYETARDTTWAWLYSVDGPMQTQNWAMFFEDQPFSITNDCQINIGEAARYLMENPELDPAWQTNAAALIARMETVFGEDQWGAMAMYEQIDWYYAMTSHTARYASVCALYHELTGDPAYRDKAENAYHWSTYGACPEKPRVMVETLDTAQFDNQNGWFTDCHGDYIQHLVAGMASIPEWAPDGENHLLRSSSMVQSIDYGPLWIEYRTFHSASVEVLRLRTQPNQITADGSPLALRGDLDQPGWTWQPLSEGGVCRIRHDTARDIRITWVEVPAAGMTSLVLLGLVLGGLLRRRSRS